MSRQAIASANTRLDGYVGAELKYVDQQVLGRVVSNSVTTADQDPATVLCLNGCAQGTGQSQRLGLRAVFKSLDIRGQIQWQSGFTQGDYVRILVFVDKQTNGAQYNEIDVLLDVGGTGYDTCAQRNLECKNRFQILSDKTYTPRGNPGHYWNGSVAATAAYVQPFRIFKKLGGKKGLVTRFLSTGGNIADIADNSIHIMALSTTTSTNVGYISRCRFYAD